MSRWRGSDASLAAGHQRYAVNHGAKVINMSVGGPTGSPARCDQALQDGVAYALEHDVVVVASAGNVLPHLGEQRRRRRQPPAPGCSPSAR